MAGYQGDVQSMKLVVIGVPVDAGAGQRGAVMGPAALRVAGLIESLQGLGFDVEDRGDLHPPAPVPGVPPVTEMRQLPVVAAWCRLTSQHAFEAMQAGALPIFLGGDHSLSMGTVTGVARHAEATGRTLTVLWLDAHADFNTPASTLSGNLHGMATALLTGEPGLEAVFGEPSRAAVPLDRLHLFGARSVDRAERVALRARGVDVTDMRMIDEMGVVAPLRRILDAVRASDSLLHVSLDVDFLDPLIAPGVGTAVPGGATFREAHLVMEMLHDSGLVSSLDVVELNPFLDVRGQSALLLADLVASLFGRSIMER